MTLFIGLLTAVLVLDCVLLILLILVQLPKKEAGAGLAFGGGAADALFGAGAGNPLTKITKYAAVTFFSLLIVISVLQKSNRSSQSDSFRSLVEQENKQVTPAPGSNPSAAPVAPAPAVNLLTSTNVSVPAVDSTNAAPK
jgi:preprotein translocase subunit SecG